MHPPKKYKFWYSIGILVALFLSTIACLSTAELVEEHSFSNLVINGDALWFGAGYKLYRVDLNQQTATVVYDTDDVRISFVQVDGKSLFFGGSSEKQNVIWSLGLDSEKILWTHKFSRSPLFNDFPIGSSGLVTLPLITNEVLLIGETNRLYALEKNSGDLEWKIENNRFDSGVLTPALANDQLIYGVYKFGKDGPEANNTIAIADLSSGRVVRTISVPGYLGGVPAVHGNCFFVKEDMSPDPQSHDLRGAHRVRLNCMDFSSGEVLWFVEGEDYLWESQIGFYNGLVLDVFGNQLFAIDEQSGSILWESQKLGGDFSYANPQVIEDLDWIALESYFPGQVIFWEVADGKLRDEKLVNLASSPLFIGHEAFYGITNAIVRVDIVTGKIIWSIPVDSHYLARQYNDD